MTEEIKEGWSYPTNSRKAHYFVNMMSLCGKYGFYRGFLEQGNDNSPDNCVQCKKKLHKAKPLEALGFNTGDDESP